MNAKFSLKWLFVGTAVVALAAAALVNASWWLNSSLRSIYGALLIVSAIVGIWRKNAFFGGVAVAGLLHSLNTLHNGFDRRLISNEVIDDLTRSGPASGNYWQAVWAILHTLWSFAVSLMGGLLAWVVDQRAQRGRQGLVLDFQPSHAATRLDVGSDRPGQVGNWTGP